MLSFKCCFVLEENITELWCMSCGKLIHVLWRNLRGYEIDRKRPLKYKWCATAKYFRLLDKYTLRFYSFMLTGGICMFFIIWLWEKNGIRGVWWFGWHTLLKLPADWFIICVYAIYYFLWWRNVEPFHSVCWCGCFSRLYLSHHSTGNCFTMYFCT